MDSFEFNKIAGALLAAALFLMVLGKVSDALVHPVIPAKPHIDVPSEPAAAGPPTADAPKAPPLPPGGDVAAGQATFTKVCTTCHTADKGGKNGTGPNLFGVHGRKPGTAAGFSTYSKCILEKTGEWTDDMMNSFLWKPAADCRGTKMAFAGLKDKDRADVVAFLKSLK